MGEGVPQAVRVDVGDAGLCGAGCAARRGRRRGSSGRADRAAAAASARKGAAPAPAESGRRPGRSWRRTARRVLGSSIFAGGTPGAAGLDPHRLPGHLRGAEPESAIQGGETAGGEGAQVGGLSCESARPHVRTSAHTETSTAHSAVPRETSTRSTRSTSTTVTDPITAIQRFIDAWNDRCAPIWTKDPEAVIAKATDPRRRTTQLTSDSHDVRFALVEGADSSDLPTDDEGLDGIGALVGVDGLDVGVVAGDVIVEQ
jgi:hypothetical protein